MKQKVHFSGPFLPLNEKTAVTCFLFCTLFFPVVSLVSTFDRFQTVSNCVAEKKKLLYEKKKKTTKREFFQPVHFIATEWLQRYRQ